MPLFVYYWQWVMRWRNQYLSDALRIVVIILIKIERIGGVRHLGAVDTDIHINLHAMGIVELHGAWEWI